MSASKTDRVASAMLQASAKGSQWQRELETAMLVVSEVPEQLR
jgi:hypothetical protein